MKGLVLAGGHGTRLRPLTFTGNKHMIPIANQPMLFYGLQHLRDAGIQDVALILGPLYEGIPEAVGDGRAFGLRVTYIHQGEPKGLAHAVLCARDYLGDDPFVMYLGDNLLQQGARPLVELFEKDHPDAVIGATPVANPSSYGVVELQGDRIASIEEKPLWPRSDLALIGVYLFTPKIHPIVAELRPSARGELEITDAIWKLCQNGSHVRVQRVEGWWKDTGRPEDLLDANERVIRSLPADRFRIEGSVEPGARIEGPVAIGVGTRIGSDVSINGPALIGPNSRLESGAKLGPGTAIGSEVTLQGCEVIRSIVMDRAQVQGPVSVEDSIVGRDVRIIHRGSETVRLSSVLGDSASIRF